MKNSLPHQTNLKTTAAIHSLCKCVTLQVKNKLKLGFKEGWYLLKVSFTQKHEGKCFNERKEKRISLLNETLSLFQGSLMKGSSVLLFHKNQKTLLSQTDLTTAAGPTPRLALLPLCTVFARSAGNCSWCWCRSRSPGGTGHRCPLGCWCPCRSQPAPRSHCWVSCRRSQSWGWPSQT